MAPQLTGVSQLRVGLCVRVHVRATQRVAFFLNRSLVFLWERSGHSFVAHSRERVFTHAGGRRRHLTHSLCLILIQDLVSFLFS